VIGILNRLVDEIQRHLGDDLAIDEIARVFRSSGPYPAALQETYAASATEWFPANPWRLRPGPSIVSVLDRAPDLAAATCELWFPVERA
jgi:AraC family transcriptional regulator